MSSFEDSLFLPMEDGAADLSAQLAAGQVIDYGVAAVHAPDAWKRTRGEGVKVAVLDTGWTNHPDVLPNAVYCPLVDGKPQTQFDLRDVMGHGTHVAGIIGAIDNNFGVVGVAPGASLYLYQCIPAGPDVLSRAIASAAADGADIISMSLGGYVDNADVHDAVRAAHDQGVVLVAAAGNDPARGVAYPAAYPEVIAVSAIDEHRRRASFAPLTENHVALPGVNILSTWTDGRYARLSGTSQATPLLAGILALLIGLFKPARDTSRHAFVTEQMARIACDSDDFLYREPDLSKL